MFGFLRKKKTEEVEETSGPITEEEMEKARGFSKQVKKYIITHDGKKEMADGSGMIKESQ